MTLSPCVDTCTDNSQALAPEPEEDDKSKTGVSQGPTIEGAETVTVGTIGAIGAATRSVVSVAALRKRHAESGKEHSARTLPPKRVISSFISMTESLCRKIRILLLSIH